jgi:hypothetical protein
MRRTCSVVALIAIVALTVAAVAACGETSNPTATVTSSATGVPSATPTPRPRPFLDAIRRGGWLYTTITVRFVYQGQPFIADSLPQVGLSADGQQCPWTNPTTAHVESPIFQQGWPAPINPDYPACPRVGAVARLCFNQDWAGGVGQMCAETQWNGSDTTVDLQVPPRPNAAIVVARFLKAGQPVSVTSSKWVYQ